MKKTPKKLVLSKETLTSLLVAQGGYATGVVCPHSDPYYCPRQPVTGVTCYC